MSLLLSLALALPALAVATAPELLSAGRADDAISSLTARVKQAPTDAEAWHLLSRAWYSVGKWDRAVDAGEKAVKLAPANSNYHMWLGRAYGEKASDASFITAARLAGRVREHFERAVALDGRNIAARSDLGEFYLEAPGFMGGGADKARAQAQQMQAQDAARAHWLEARIQEKMKKNAAAEQEYRAAIKASGNQASYWLNLASFYRRASRFDDMEKAIAQALAASRNSGAVLYDAAGMLHRSGRNFSLASQLLRSYLANTPEEEAPAFKAHHLLGSILEKQGKKQEAAAEYQAALSLARDYSPARESLKRVGK